MNGRGVNMAHKSKQKRLSILLLAEGYNVNERPNIGLGSTPLVIAINSLKDDDPVLNVILKNGAVYSYDNNEFWTYNELI